jgi:hypothetical protein
MSKSIWIFGCTQTISRHDSEGQEPEAKCFLVIAGLLRFVSACDELQPLFWSCNEHVLVQVIRRKTRKKSDCVELVQQVIWRYEQEEEEEEDRKLLLYQMLF